MKARRHREYDVTPNDGEGESSMAARAGQILRGTLIAAAFASPFLTHCALATGQGLHLVAVIVSVQILIAALAFPSGRIGRLRWLAVAAGAVSLVLASQAAQPVLVATTGLSHALIHGGLLAWFASSLRPGREALVSSLARQVHGELDADLAAYTRNVTKSWCLFFAAQLATSAALLALAPTTVWSLFVNVLDLPIVAAMFVGEYLYRIVRFRNGNPATLAQSINAFRRRAARSA
jgi:uncharacterized membrane protein